MGPTKINQPRGEQRNHKQRRHDVHHQSSIQELPQDGNVVVPANVRNQEVSELRRGEADAGPVQAGSQLHSPEQGIAPLLLGHLRHVQYAVPHAPPHLRRCQRRKSRHVGARSAGFSGSKECLQSGRVLLSLRRLFGFGFQPMLVVSSFDEFFS